MEVRKKNSSIDETIIVGYSSVYLIVGTSLFSISATCGTSISDNVRKNIYVYINPCRIVMVEKNTVEAFHKGWIERRKFHRTFRGGLG